MQRLGSERERNPRHRHVRAARQCSCKIDRAEIVLIFDDLDTDLHHAGRGIDDALIIELPRCQGGGHHERLDRGARLNEIGDRAILVTARLVLSAIVRVEGRLVHHREHFASRDVDHDDRARLRPMLLHGRLQFSIREILQTHIEGERHVATRAHWLDALDRLYGATEIILNDTLSTVVAGEPVVVDELETFLTLVVHAREADHVACHLTGRIVAAIFARQMYPGDVERANLGRVGRLHMPRDVQELSLQIRRDALLELLGVAFKSAGQIGNLIGAESQFFGVDPYRVDRRADRERLTHAIGDAAAMRHDRSHTRETFIALAAQEIILDQLQSHRFPRQSDGTHSHQTRKQIATKHERGRRCIRLATQATARAAPGRTATCRRRRFLAERPADHANLVMAPPLRSASAAVCAYRDWSPRRSRRKRASRKRSARVAGDPIPSRDDRARD